MVALYLLLTLAPAPECMSRIGLLIRSLSSLIMSTFAALDQIQLGQPATVKVSANLARLLSYNNKDSLQTGLIVGGWDKYEGGKIYGIPLGGTVLEQPFAIGGSGSTYLYGFFDQAWKEGMTQEEAEKLVVTAVSLAIARDGASGGVVRTVTINKDGATRKFYPGDSLQLWHEELEPVNSLLDVVSVSSPDPMVIYFHWHTLLLILKIMHHGHDFLRNLGIHLENEKMCVSSHIGTKAYEKIPQGFTLVNLIMHASDIYGAILRKNVGKSFSLQWKRCTDFKSLRS
ncbi:proteasome subunit beta type-6 isoform X2 [Solanum dulcamara]|uniref:proteasome subunit beta type-6 isoform X2 n=1 Tax=Solanum dulcamara TaxID=45834 RepID=UPI0024857009|nr:proteasome subunit beta type-6 isoform X2 [Solanum dulcamara]